MPAATSRFMESSMFLADLLAGHEPKFPLSRPSAFAKATADKPGTLSPAAGGGEGRGEGAHRFMGREHLQNLEANRLQEP